MSFESFLNDLNDSINLSDSNCTDVLKFWDALLALRNTASNNDWLFDFFSFAYHVNESSLGRVNDSTAVDEDEVSIFRVFYHSVAVFDKLSNHELTVGDVMGATESFDINRVTTWCFLTLVN